MHHFAQTIALLETSSVYYLIAIGMDNNYTYVSPNYDRNFGVANDSLLGKPFHITLHPDDVAICGEVGGRCFENPQQMLSAVLRKHDGKGGYIFTQWEFRAFFDEQSNPAGIFCIGYNITEYVDTRSKLVMAKTEIESKIDQLYQIGFLQSHVVRKPLANLIGLVNVLISMDTSEGVQEINNMLLDSANELDAVIKKIVDKAS